VNIPAYFDVFYTTVGIVFDELDHEFVFVGNSDSVAAGDKGVATKGGKKSERRSRPECGGLGVGRRKIGVVSQFCGN